MIIVYFTMLIQVIFLQVVDGRRFLQIKKKKVSIEFVDTTSGHMAN